ncbi:MAG: GNAT family N-acetyltransferase [Candidatus Eremiobacteraeota bacterium]|nr:GNAT family N-acetyltransferase [Candidatus Eremiobacteraeota bacterium]
MSYSSAIALTDFHIHVDERTEIRPLHMRDVEELFHLVTKNRDHLYPWMAWIPEGPYTQEMTREYLELVEQKAHEQSEFHAVLVRDGHLIGDAGFPMIDWRNRVAHIGYWLDKDHVGSGIMTSAVRALTGYAFDALELNRIEIRCSTQNIASAAVAQRLGFVHEGILRQAFAVRDTYTDDNVFAMLREDWDPSP